MCGQRGVKYFSAKEFYGLSQLDPIYSYIRIEGNYTGQSQAGVRLPDFNNSKSGSIWFHLYQIATNRLISGFTIKTIINIKIKLKLVAIHVILHKKEPTRWSKINHALSMRNT